MQLENRINLQKNLLFSGLILLCSSLGYYFIWEGTVGNMMRYGALVGGFGLIMLASVIPPVQYLYTKMKIIAVGFAIVGIFFLLTVLKGYGEFSTQQFLFQTVSMFLFVAGVLLYDESFRRGQFTPKWYFWILYLVSLLGLSRFLWYVDGLSGWSMETSRGLGLEELNPIGVAYTQVSLILVFFGGFMASRALLGKVGFLGGLILAVTTCIITGSRGAALFGSLAIVFLVVIYLRNHFSYQRLLWVIGIALSLVLLLILTILNVGSVYDRFSLLLTRFQSFGLIMDGYSSGDGSSGRIEMWQYHLHGISDWFLMGDPAYIPYPHNLYIEFVARFGVIGLLVGLCMLLVVLRFIYLTLIRSGYLEVGDVLFAGLFMYSFMQAQTSLSLELNRMLWIGLGYVVMHVIMARSRHGNNPVHRQGEQGLVVHV